MYLKVLSYKILPGDQKNIRTALDNVTYFRPLENDLLEQVSPQTNVIILL